MIEDEESNQVNFTNINREMLGGFTSVRSVMYLGMELYAEIFSLHVAHRRKGTIPRFSQGDKSFWHTRDLIAV